MIELFDLSDNPSELLARPREAPRPLLHMLRDAFALAQELTFGRRLLARTEASTRASMTRELDERRRAAASMLELFQREASLSELGARVLGELAELVASEPSTASR